MWWSQALKLAVAVISASAGFGLAHHLPPRWGAERHWGGGNFNSFGQGPGAALLSAVAILILLCSLRYAIVCKGCCRADAAAWYLLLLSAAVPAVWLLVELDWDNEAVSPLANWVGTPVALLLVPTLFAGYDVVAANRLPLGLYAGRSLLEILVLVPVWFYIWVAYFEFLLLGWFGF